MQLLTPLTTILSFAPLRPFRSLPAKVLRRRHSSATVSTARITESEVSALQSKWADAIVNISSLHANSDDFVAAAKEAAGELYGYDYFPVLFKPTKARTHQFRPTPSGAISYFIGCDNVSEGGISEDKVRRCNAISRHVRVKPPVSPVFPLTFVVVFAFASPLHSSRCSENVIGLCH